MTKVHGYAAIIAHGYAVITGSIQSTGHDGTCKQMSKKILLFCLDVSREEKSRQVPSTFPMPRPRLCIGPRLGTIRQD